jgi:hypothetical protein
MVFFGDDRYHLPILPIISVFSAFALFKLVEGLQVSRLWEPNGLKSER